MAADIIAVIGLQPPDGDDKTRLDAIGLGDFRKLFLVSGHHFTALVDAPVRKPLVGIAFIGQGKFGLSALELKNFGVGL